MIGMWNKYGWANLPPQPPTDETTFRLGAQFLRYCDVEDWGCGTGWFRRYAERHYRGVDGSITPAVDVVADLASYRSSTEGLFVRHVLEHNWSWEEVLENALASFRQRFVLVVFTPFWTEVNKASVIVVNDDIPDLRLPYQRITAMIDPFWWSERTVDTKTQYGRETIFFVERPLV